MNEILTYNLDYLRQCLVEAYTTAIESDGGLAAYIPEGEAALMLNLNGLMTLFQFQ